MANLTHVFQCSKKPYETNILLMKYKQKHQSYS